MDAGCYVPNNPAHFGLEAWPAEAANPAAPGGVASDMGAFALPPLDLEPLPSLFPFSPGASYKDLAGGGAVKEPGVKGGGGPGGHDMADVLLSLKHAVVHPGQISGPLSPNAFAPSYLQQPPHQLPSAQLSYTVHPHHQQEAFLQMMSPSGGYGGQYCGADPTGYAPQQQSQSSQHSAAPMFPSMSVNVSMNMTMGYNVPDHQMACPQMQWGQSSSPGVYHQQSQGLLSPGAYSSGGATYSFTADFRPMEAAAPSSFKPLKASPLAFGARRRSAGSTCSFGGGKASPTGVGSAAGATGDGDCGAAGGGANPRANLCRICGKTYARPSTLKTHLRTHSGEKPYRCAECHKSFSQAANLTAHVRTHSGEKPFRCPICDRRFSQSSSVTTHMRTHSGERPYRCRMCKKAFSDSSTLTKHLRIHSGEKPYQCKLCLLRFSQSGNLNRHMRVHGNAAA